MPELPEVETVVGQLATSLPGLEIRGVAVTRPDLLRESPRRFRSALLGARFLGVGRRGKKIVLSLSGEQLLVVSLGMTGQLLFLPSTAEGEAPPFRAVSFTLEPGAVLHYADARRFGRLQRFTPREWESESARLGPEPLDRALTAGSFHRILALSRSPVRSWLLDQRRVAGIGNIYAAEALFKARIHPARPASSLTPGEARQLLTAIRDVLREAIRAKGTTLRDYRTAAGESGGFSPSLRVYGKEGNPCVACNTPVKRIVFGNRSAFFCPHCQAEDQ